MPKLKQHNLSIKFNFPPSSTSYPVQMPAKILRCLPTLTNSLSWLLQTIMESLLHPFTSAFSLARLFTVSYFSVGFSRLVRFDQTPTILVCNSGRNLGRLSKLLRGAGVGRSILTRGPLSSLGTLPMLCSPLQTKMVEV